MAAGEICFEVVVSLPPEEALQELDLKVNVSLRLLARFACLHRRWPANPIYIDLIKGLEAHLEYWEFKRLAIKQELESAPASH
jgi:hypothetical protein